MKPGGQRTKGHNFERKVSRAYKAIFGDLGVRRGEQAHGALEPDVLVKDWPLWTECEHSKTANPTKKLLQAERDVKRAGRTDHVCVSVTKRDRMPIVVAMRVGGLIELLDKEWCDDDVRGLFEIRLDWNAFLYLLQQWSKT